MMPIDKKIESLIRAHKVGAITDQEFFALLWEYIQEFLASLAAVLNHPDAGVRDVAIDISNQRRQAEMQVKDVAEISRTSPLQPSTRVMLTGCFVTRMKELPTVSSIMGTFTQFTEGNHWGMPAAIIELDHEIDTNDECWPDRQYKGRLAILQQYFRRRNWTAQEIVVVHIAETMPTDIAVFCSSHPRFGFNASYEIVRSEDSDDVRDDSD